MKKIMLIPAVCMIALLSACSNESKQEESTASSPEAEVANNIVADTMTPASMDQAVTIDTSTGIQLQPTANPFTQQNGATGIQQKTAEGMNPPHGEPGHRCDIPVGAPLNSPPSQQPAATNTMNAPVFNQPAPSIQQPAPAPATSSTPPAPGQKLNPPHGEPGHDCAIPVGAPLNK